MKINNNNNNCKQNFTSIKYNYWTWSFSKKKRILIRTTIYTLHPSYNKVQKEKTNCYSDSIDSPESFISSYLQDLINSTKRIILSQNLKIIMNLKQLCFLNVDLMAVPTIASIILIIKKMQKIMVFICPIKLFVEIDGTILWCNNVPNLPKYCKPL